MTSKIIQISFSEEEYENLTILANADGNTVPQYIKNVVLPNNDFKRWFPELVKRVNDLEEAEDFNIKEVMGVDWKKIPKGIKLAMGRVFYQQVADGTIKGVKPTRIDSTKTQCYKKEK